LSYAPLEFQGMDADRCLQMLLIPSWCGNGSTVWPHSL